MLSGPRGGGGVFRSTARETCPSGRFMHGKSHLGVTSNRRPVSAVRLYGCTWGVGSGKHAVTRSIVLCNEGVSV
jgi:hypothetical protein